MGAWGIGHWLVVALVVLLLFGKGRFSDLMGDMAKGIKSFKKGMAEDDSSHAQAAQKAPTQLPPQPAAARELNADPQSQPLPDEASRQS
jgi:sec-independent protein translocase protein TatA